MSLHGTIVGNPTPSVKWLHNGKAIQEDVRLVSSLSPRAFVEKSPGNKEETTEMDFLLEIHNFSSAEHSGTYTAVGSNKYGDIYCSTVLTSDSEANIEG